MSTRTTIIRTGKEHWFTEGTPELVDGEYVRDVLTIDIHPDNVIRIEQDKEGVSIDLKPGSELYRVLMEKLTKREFR
jgi:hypothetical protein